MGLCPRDWKNAISWSSRCLPMLRLVSNSLMDTYLYPRLFFLVGFDFFLTDFEGDRLRVIFWYNVRSPERIDKVLDSPNQIVGVADSDSFRDNADSMAIIASFCISLFSFTRAHRFIPRSVFKEGVRFFTQSVIFSPFSISWHLCSFPPG